MILDEFSEFINCNSHFTFQKYGHRYKQLKNTIDIVKSVHTIYCSYLANIQNLKKPNRYDEVN